MIKRSPQEWQQLIEAQQSSNMTIAQFCQAHNINQSTYYLQRKKLSELAVSQASSHWLPIETMIKPEPDNRRWQIELTLPNGVVLNMSTDG